jgi:hypothetical protein
MSELKVYHHELRHNEYEEFYLKSEADKVIAEKDAEIARLKAIRKVHIEAIESMGAGLQQDEEEILHQKYKRCLAMAEWCEERCARYDLLQEHSGFSWRMEIDFYFRWYQRWLELAEKFNEAK